MGTPPKTAGGPLAPGTAREAKPDANQTGCSLFTVAPGALRPLDLAVIITAEANRMDAERRDRECRCPGRAYVAHAWHLGSHKGSCRADRAWLSVDDTRAVLRTMQPRKLAELRAALGGAA